MRAAVAFAALSGALVAWQAPCAFTCLLDGMDGAYGRGPIDGTESPAAEPSSGGTVPADEAPFTFDGAAGPHSDRAATMRPVAADLESVTADSVRHERRIDTSRGSIRSGHGPTEALDPGSSVDPGSSLAGGAPSDSGATGASGGDVDGVAGREAAAVVQRPVAELDATEIAPR